MILQWQCCQNPWIIQIVFIGLPDVNKQEKKRLIAFVNIANRVPRLDCYGKSHQIFTNTSMLWHLRGDCHSSAVYFTMQSFPLCPPPKQNQTANPQKINTDCQKGIITINQNDTISNNATPTTSPGRLKWALFTVECLCVHTQTNGIVFPSLNLLGCQKSPC